MKNRKKKKGLFFHAGLVCLMARIIIGILDWYNPYMDFAGHAGFLKVMFLFAAAGYLYFRLGKHSGSHSRSRRSVPMIRKFS